MKTKTDMKTKKDITRRDFLQRSTAVGIAAGFPAIIPSSALGGTGASANGELRLGLVGCGGRGRHIASHAMDADPGARLVALADIFRERAEGAREWLKERRPDQVTAGKDDCFVGLDAYKDVIESSDVVLIANAAKFHPMQMTAAIEAGKHVFVEKPHAIDPAGIQMAARAMELAKRNGLGVLSGLHSRFQANIKETIQRVQDGQIGDIVSVEENFLRAPYFGFNFRHRPKGMREIELQYGSQYRFAWLCGDDVTQSLVHNLDRATWALGETPPTRCHGLAGRSGEPVFGDVFDHHAVVYRYENGVRVYANCRTTRNCYNGTSSTIMGTKGIAYVLGGRITGENPWRFDGELTNPVLVAHREFYKSIREGNPLHCGDYMTRSTLATIMGQLSCYSGREISWERAEQSEYVLPPAAEDCSWDMAPPTAPDADGVYPVPATPGVRDERGWPAAYGAGQR